MSPEVLYKSHGVPVNINCPLQGLLVLCKVRLTLQGHWSFASFSSTQQESLVPCEIQWSPARVTGLLQESLVPCKCQRPSARVIGPVHGSLDPSKYHCSPDGVISPQQGYWSSAWSFIPLPSHYSPLGVIVPLQVSLVPCTCRWCPTSVTVRLCRERIGN